MNKRLLASLLGKGPIIRLTLAGLALSGVAPALVAQDMPIDSGHYLRIVQGRGYACYFPRCT